MADRLMNALRHFFGFDTAPNGSTSTEQQAIERRLERIAARIDQRQKRLDNELQVLAADRRDARRR